ncbi:MAG: trypsin-like peptidase domain-containing protein, partial [Planctomycetota bacterium]
MRAEYEASGQGLSDVSLEQLTSAYQMVSQRVAPSVVHIEVIASGLAEDDLSVAASNSSNRRSPLRDPSVAPPMDASKQTTASDAMAAPTGALMGPDQYTIFPSDKGSGVIVDADDHQGFVLTNLHVLSSGGAARVILSDGRKVAATVVGVDAMTDLALLQINASGLIPIAWGDSDACRVGSPVWAIGSPFGLDRTVTFGIISGKHRIVRASAR